MRTVPAVAFLIGALATTLPGRIGAQSRPARDTVDVPVGSAIVDGARTHDHVVRTEQLQLRGDSALPAGTATWTISTGDSAGVRVRRVHGEGDSRRPDGSKVRTSTDATFNLRTLAPISLIIRAQAGDNAMHVSLAFDGSTIRGERAMGANTQPINVTLPQASFLGSLADLVAEVLPRRVGTVYRLHLWQPGGGPAAVTHLYETTGREDIEVLGVKYPQAWVVVDKNADGAELSRMWLVDAPPYLVRWDEALPDGSRLRLNQQLGSATTH